MPVGTISNTPNTIGGALIRKSTEAFRFVVDRHDKVLEYQFGLARWMLASLLVANGGALIAIVNSAKNISGVTESTGWFVTGLVTALLCGLLAWLNCNLITIAADYRLDWKNLDIQNSTIADRLELGAWILGVASATVGLVSLIAFPIGALRVEHAISIAKRSIPTRTAEAGSNGRSDVARFQAVPNSAGQGVYVLDGKTGELRLCMTGQTKGPGTIGIGCMSPSRSLTGG